MSDEPAADAREPFARNLREWLYGKPVDRQVHWVLGVVLPGLVAIYSMWRVRAHTVDDAYISFRYARNFARGLGLVYNAGERIEGYTNFLWTLLMGGAIRLGLDPIIVAKLLGAACSLACIAFAYEIARRLRPYSIVPCVAGWLLASTAVAQGHAVFGLETALFSCLLLAGTWLFLREEGTPPPPQARGGQHIPWSGAVFAAAGLTRPEAPLYIGLLMMFMAGKPLLSLGRGEEQDSGVDLVQDRAIILFCCILTIAVMLAVQLSVGIHSIGVLVAGSLVVLLSLALFVASAPRTIFGRRNLVRLSLFTLPVALHHLWRHDYYGRWLPNTLTAKTGDLVQQVRGGAHYVAGVIDHEGPILYLALFGLAAGLVWRRLEILAMGAIVLCGGVYVVIVGGDWMVMYRFFAPLLPFVFILVDLAVRTLVEKQSKVANYGLLMFALLVVGQRSHQMAQDVQLVLGHEKRFWDSAAGGVSTWFERQVASRGRDAVHGTIALGDIGEIGYRTDFPILDLLGLVDPTISQLDGGYTTKVDAGFRDRFFEVSPRYFILISAEGDCQHPSVIGSKVLYEDDRFADRYRVSGRVELDDGFVWCVYEHVDDLDRR